MENINSLRDKKTGRFQTTTNNTTYKMVQFNNKRMGEHNRAICMALNIPVIPKGFVIHHLDEDKRNNDIHNLSLMSITAHNRLHAHEPWNKGIKTSENSLFKQRESTDKHYIEVFKTTNDLKETGLNNTEIAKIQGIKRQTVILRLKRYKELTQKYE